MKHTIFFLLLFYSFISYSQVNKDWIVYTDATNTFSISRPDSFILEKKVEKNSIIRIYPPLEGHERYESKLDLFMMPGEVPAGYSLKKATDLTIAGVKKNTREYKQLAYKLVTINGKQAYEVSYSAYLNQMQFKLKVVQHYYIHRKRLYVISYTTDNGMKDVNNKEALACLKSFRLL